AGNLEPQEAPHALGRRDRLRRPRLRAAPDPGPRDAKPFVHLARRRFEAGGQVHRLRLRPARVRPVGAEGRARRLYLGPVTPARRAGRGRGARGALGSRPRYR
ncbi:hypothetical protein AVDCRST_MAG82-3755, partial [uncultured Rubrobacteraceae bacterium]